MYISNPTWGNHRNIFNDAGLEWKYYRYFNPDDISLDFAGMLEDIKGAPDGSVIVLHGVCCSHISCYFSYYSAGRKLVFYLCLALFPLRTLCAKSSAQHPSGVRIKAHDGVA